jgi:hypothetical protein
MELALNCVQCYFFPFFAISAELNLPILSSESQIVSQSVSQSVSKSIVYYTNICLSSPYKLDLIFPCFVS